jgi:hypothetical protein
MRGEVPGGARLEESVIKLVRSALTATETREQLGLSDAEWQSMGESLSGEGIRNLIRRVSYDGARGASGSKPPRPSQRPSPAVLRASPVWWPWANRFEQLVRTGAVRELGDRTAGRRLSRARQPDSEPAGARPLDSGTDPIPDPAGRGRPVHYRTGSAPGSPRIAMGSAARVVRAARRLVACDLRSRRPVKPVAVARCQYASISLAFVPPRRDECDDRSTERLKKETSTNGNIHHRL